VIIFVAAIKQSYYLRSYKDRNVLNRPAQPFDSGSILLTIAHGFHHSKSNALSAVEGKYIMYFVYILRTSSNTLYIGQTNNLEKRIKEHRKKASKSARYVKYFSSFNLVYSEIYLTRKEAMQREAQLKRWSRSKKEALIMDDKILLKKL